MRSNDDSPEHAAELRKRAEDAVRERAIGSPEGLDVLSRERMQEMLHELQVHQIELEMQNDELRRAQVELEAARTQYFDLYDLAPLGYYTVSEKGLILEANLTAATLLGVNRDTLINKPITRFIVPADQDIYYLHRKALVERGAPQSCELRMLKADGTEFWTHLAINAAEEGHGVPVCRVAMSDISERKRAEEALKTSQEELRVLASALAQTEEKERRRIAAYLHDEIGQLLVAIRVRFGLWKKRNASMNAPEILVDIERMIDQSIDDTRLLTYELSPPILFELGLGPALEWLGDQLCNEHGIEFEFRDAGQTTSIPEALAGALYGIARELLMNVVKHAHAKHASVSTALTAGVVRVIVEDDGVGMDTSLHTGESLQSGKHFGLFSIHERLRHFGGSLKLDSALGGGTRAQVTVPLDQSEVAEGDSR